jgi:hypothetical protein
MNIRKKKRMGSKVVSKLERGRNSVTQPGKSDPISNNDEICMTYTDNNGTVHMPVWVREPGNSHTGGPANYST